MIRKTCRWLAVAAVSLLGSLGAPQLAAQAGGTITGRVTESSGEALAAVQVNVVGTSVRTSTDVSGQFTLRGVPTGRNVTVQAQRVGFAEQARTVMVPSGGTATVSFQLQAAAVQLAEIVATATGERRRVEVGNAVTQVNAATLVEERPVANMSDLLTARAPGVQVLPGGMTGTGARVRVRGTSSLSLSNDPIYIIDGVRMQSSRESSSISTGGQLPSRLGDINPEEIESMEVVKGPSAATLYGTDAANGVIVIRTKRGRAGRPQWNLYTEQGILEDRNEYPAAYRAYTRSTGFTPTTPSSGSQCFLADRARAACTQDSVTSYNLFANPRTTPYARGNRQQYGVQVSGGTEAMRYFVSGEREQETGVLRMPSFEQVRLERQGVALRDEWVRPNAMERFSGRANLNLTFSPKADVAISTGFTHQTLRLPQHENNAVGLGSNAYGGPGSGANTNAAGDSLFGYRAYAPGDIFQLATTQGIDRFIGSISGNYRPLEWLTARANTGLDFTSRVDEEICRRGECPNFSTYRQGFKRDNRSNFYTGSLDGSMSAEFQPVSWLQTRTTVGAQFYRDVFDRNGSYGENLPPGGTQITSAATLFASESTSESRTFGAFLEENLTFGDRLFITAGLRSDRNSAFGADFATVYYPKLAASYVISEERWFPNFGGTLDELRFRAAWGASGVQPGTTDAVQFLAATQVRVDGAELPGVAFSSLGNRNLRPERSEELELGVDGTFLNNRVNAEFTYYDKRSADALIERVLPPSLGTGSTQGTGGTTTRFENLGAVRNWGYEALVNAQLVQRRTFGWDVTLNGSTNSNELEDLGDVPPIIGATIRQIEGFPINGWWQRPIVSFEDKNSDGILGVDEVVVGDTAVFMGYSIPRHEVAVTNGFDFANRTVRLVAMFDYKGGSRQLYGTERIRCQNRGNCRGALDPTAPLEEQAAALALRSGALGNSQAGYIVDNSFIRFRELALNVSAPQGWARRVGSRSLSATVSARNIKLWSDYPGVDPETGYGTDVVSDFQSQPPPTYITLRLNLGL